MVQSAAERAFLPVRHVLEEFGDMMLLTGRTLSSALKPPYPYGGELVSQFLFTLRLCWFPLLVSTVAINYGAPGLQAANFLNLIGGLDRLGAFFIVIVVRELGPFITSIVIAGVAGTAITADLGARKVREELDALQVLGVDPVKNLVVPRFLALMLVTGLFNIYAVLFGLFGGDPRRPLERRLVGPVLEHAFRKLLDHRPVGLGAQGDDVWGDHRDRVLLQGHERLRRRGGGRARGQRSRRDLLPRDRGLQLRLHPDAAGHPSPDPGDPMNEWLAVPRELLESTGEIGRFTGKVVRDVWSLRVFRFFGEALRQSGILIIYSTLVIWSLAFLIGLGACGIEAAYFNQSINAPTYAGVYAAWCNLREAVPYVFGYMMAAKVGTGIVAELGAMRISEEIDALEVMGVDSMLFLCATRLLAAWIVLPFMYIGAIGVAYLASYIAIVDQLGYVSSGGFLLVFWQFQNPADFLYSVIKGMTMATAIVLVACYYGYNASGGPVGVGKATAKSMVLNLVLIHLIGMFGTQVFWGGNARAPVGG